MAQLGSGQQDPKPWSCFMKAKSFGFALLFLLLCSLAIAAQTDCPQHYRAGQAPDFVNEKLATKTQHRYQPEQERIGSDSQKIAALLNSVVKQLGSEELPESIPPLKQEEVVKNPFG